MKRNIMKAAPAASAIELKNEKSAKAKRILVGADVHLRGYQAARKIDSGVIGVVENFRSLEALLLYVEKQCERAEQVVVVYEAGPLGYTLYVRSQAISGNGGHDNYGRGEKVSERKVKVIGICAFRAVA
jgi:hypothetical protein